jgi:1,4-alpha-glucan branching enzyme
MAEDSSAHDGVTRPVDMGGLGFNYKWNMGWMNDTLRYFKLDPIYRKYHHNLITFGLVYAFSEQYILPLSHDEVVHLKASLLNKMPGDYWQKFANYRALMGLMMTHPGKKLLFMGGEFAHYTEWNFKKELDWNLYKYPAHDSANRFVRDMIATYRREKALFSSDHKKEGFKWIEGNNSEQSIFVFARYSEKFDDHVVVVFNATPVVYHDYAIGVPGDRDYKEIINSDLEIYGGSGQYNGAALKVIKEPMHNQPNQIKITVPPLGVAVFKMKRKGGRKPKTTK